MAKVDSSVPLMYQEGSEGSWITDPGPDHPKEIHP